MSYEVIIPKQVAKQIKTLPTKIRSKVLSKLSSLEQEPRPEGIKKLKGYERTYRLRIGDYRVVYDIEDEKLIILVITCQHRSHVYKEMN